jgi:hypothetical protein
MYGLFASYTLLQDCYELYDLLNLHTDLLFPLFLFS